MAWIVFAIGQRISRTHTHAHTDGRWRGRQSGEKKMIEETKSRDVLIERCGGSMNPIRLYIERKPQFNEFSCPCQTVQT